MAFKDRSISGVMGLSAWQSVESVPAVWWRLEKRAFH